jgi:YjjG family noncanonical pyrimidine nucleotidase
MKSGTGMAKKYKCVFFDLDHTLWDYEENSKETLYDLFYAYELQAKGVTSADTFYRQFRVINLALWDLYDNNRVDQHYIRQERFKQVLEHFSAYTVQLSEHLTVDYLDQCPKKANLVPHALEILEYLASDYVLTVVTNGFDEIQNVKLSSGNLHRFFNHIVTSQKAGHRKPSQKIFQFALQANNIKCSDAVMIGDNLITDIGGARNAAIDSIFYNPEKIAHQTSVKYEISCLSELKKIL